MNSANLLRKAVLTAFILLFSSPISAQETEDLHRALKEMQQQLHVLQERVEVLQAEIEKKETISKSPDIDVLIERVEELETVAVEVDDKVGSRPIVKAFDGFSLDLGGFFDATATIAIGENSTEIAFNRQVFELLAKARLNENWELFVAQAFIRNSPLTFTDPLQRTTPTFANNNSPVATDTVIAWGQYHHSDAFNVQFGRFITPHGIVNVEHFPASLLDTEQPQFLRPFNDQTIFANFTNGINIHGSKFLGDDILKYAVYGGAWAGNATSGSYGARLDYTFGNNGVTLGVNGFSGDRSSDNEGDRFYAGGVDLLIDRGPILWKNEIFLTSERDGNDRFAYYSQPALRLSDSWTILYRYDFLDTSQDGGKTVEHTAGVVFDPASNVRLRAFYRQSRNQPDIIFETTKASILQLSTTFSF